MRSFVVAVFALFSMCFSAGAQDASQMAAQQAMQAAQQANQQAMQANQQAAEATQRANEQAVQAAQQAAYCCGPRPTAPPRFSRKAGIYRSGVKVRLKDPTRGAVMYYTTDGWTPTPASRRYTGPITVDSTTLLQAIAVAPGHKRSSIASAVYRTTGSPAPPIPPTATVRPGGRVHLVFSSTVSSKGLQIGDTLPVVLAQDLVLGGVVVAPRSTPVSATVTQVDESGGGGEPGTITFTVHSVILSNGETIPVSGTETMDGRSRKNIADVLYMLPLGGLFVHGEQARIPKGAMFTAYIQGRISTVSAKTEPQPVSKDDSSQ